MVAVDCYYRLVEEKMVLRNHGFDFVTEENMSLLTDLYELTMCASYFENTRNELATFDLLIRKMSPRRSYFLFAGLEQALLFIRNMHFASDQIQYLREQGFKEAFLSYLKNLRFTGEVWAVPEGTVVFANEPLMRVTAPIIEAQLIESFLLNTVNFQTMVATKASRVVTASQGRSVVEFGLRRTHGSDAGMKAARCSFIAGCDGTSNVLAGMKHGIPIFGTMAHSFVMFFDKEIDAFRAFAKTFPEKSLLLIDTFNDIAGAEKAVIVAKELEKQRRRLTGVRIDSGDLVEQSKQIRAILDENGLGYVKVFASGDLDEYKIEYLLHRDARIDAFGVGTRMSTSEDKPYIDVIYKLSEKMDKTNRFAPTMKLSKGKITLPGRKKVLRIEDSEGHLIKDIIALDGERIGGNPLLIKVMEKGELVHDLPNLEEIRKNARQNLAKLPAKYKKLRRAPHYPVETSPLLKKMIKDLTAELRKAEITGLV